MREDPGIGEDREWEGIEILKNKTRVEEGIYDKRNLINSYH